MKFTLKVEKREIGKHSMLTKARIEDRVPGIIYGYKKEGQAIDIDYNALLNVLKQAGKSNIISLDLDGKEVKAIVRDYQQHPVTDKLIHIDFLAITEDREITTVVPLEFVGASKAIKELGAKLDIKNNEVNIKCLPGNLPSQINVDISKLEDIGQMILISQLDVYENVKVLNNPNDPVAGVVIPRKLEIIEEEPEEEVVEGEEGEEKKEGEEVKEGEEKKEGEEVKEGEENKEDK